MPVDTAGSFMAIALGIMQQHYGHELANKYLTECVAELMAGGNVIQWPHGTA